MVPVKLQGCDPRLSKLATENAKKKHRKEDPLKQLLVNLGIYHQEFVKSVIIISIKFRISSFHGK